MNYFAHGCQYLGDPYFVAGAAVPDWLSAHNRKVRARSKNAQAIVEDQDHRAAAVARGIVQHHHDDAWFHNTRAFAELSLQFTHDTRRLLPPDNSLRPSFVGHILVELLLDSHLISQDPHRLDHYYEALESVDAAVVQATVNRIATQRTETLTVFIERFCRARFLYDYQDDEKLLTRLNNVMDRVGLATLPDTLLTWLPEARAAVAKRSAELLGKPASAARS